ncbi:MAG: cardiolipin synthase [Clostridia bacterium]
MERTKIKWLLIIGFVVLAAVLGYTYLKGIGIDFFQTPIFAQISEIFNLVFTINIGFIAIFIFLENKDPSRTIAWLVVLFLLPWVGFVFYILFGRTTFKRKLRADSGLKDPLYLKHTVEMQMDTLKSIKFETKTKDIKKLIKLLLENSSSIVTSNNNVEVLTNGEDTFSSMLEAIEKAKDHIHLEFFIIKDSEIGEKFKRLLMKKAKQGVKVRVIYDAVGSWKLSDAFINDLAGAGVEIHPFRPVLFPLFSRDLNYRNHRKIIVVDGKVGFLGGLNIGDEYLGKNKKLGFWRDTHIKIEGEATSILQLIFFNGWNYVVKEELPFDMHYYPPYETMGDTMTQIVASGADSSWLNIMQAYFKMIMIAEDRLWISTPYLVPNEAVLTALKTAALSGVDVKIIIPSKADHFTAYWASQDNIEGLLEAGVKIFKYKKGFIHAKVLLVDDICVSIGTANLDYRSLELNYEVNAFMYDKDIVIRVLRDFRQDFLDSEIIDFAEFKKRPLRHKILEAFGRLVSPLQ